MEVESLTYEQPENPSISIDPDYLERRNFICPDCLQSHIVYVYERNNEIVLSCRKCKSNFKFNWDTDRFTNEAREIIFTEL